MVLSLLWVMTLTAPLIALMLSAGCTALPRPVTEVGFVTTAPIRRVPRFHLTWPRSTGSASDLVRSNWGQPGSSRSSRGPVHR